MSRKGGLRGSHGSREVPLYDVFNYKVPASHIWGGPVSVRNHITLMSAFSIHKAVFKKVSKNCRTVTSLSWLYLKFSRSKTYLSPPKPNLLPILFLFNGITTLFPSTNTKTFEPTSTLPPPYAPIASSLLRFLVLQWQHCVSPTLSHPDQDCPITLLPGTMNFPNSLFTSPGNVQLFTWPSQLLSSTENYSRPPVSYLLSVIKSRVIFCPV